MSEHPTEKDAPIRCVVCTATSAGSTYLAFIAKHAHEDMPTVLDLDDPYFNGQSLPDVLREYTHVHSTTGVCVKAPDGRFCQTRPLPPAGGVTHE